MIFQNYDKINFLKCMNPANETKAYDVWFDNHVYQGAMQLDWINWLTPVRFEWNLR